MPPVSQLDVRRIEKDLRKRVEDWRGLLTKQAPIARQIVTKLVDGRFVFTPQEDGSWEFVGRASVGKILQGIVLPWQWRPQRDSTLVTSLFSEGFGDLTGARHRS